MKKLLFGIFAHPDDEAFGPCGTLIKEVQSGAELHIITLTRGEAGQNPDHVPDLGATREDEWRRAGEVIGTSSLTNLSFNDGQLNNTTMQHIQQRLLDIITPFLQQNVAVEFLTFEAGGMTGHIDHIVASRAASFAYYKLKQQAAPVHRIRYYCLSRHEQPSVNVDWIFMNQGYDDGQINETVDAREYREHIIDAMQQHVSQREDYQHRLESTGDNLGLDHFIVQV